MQRFRDQLTLIDVMNSTLMRMACIICAMGLMGIYKIAFAQELNFWGRASVACVSICCYMFFRAIFGIAASLCLPEAEPPTAATEDGQK